MPGTKHFTRMQYNVSRGLREIVAPRQTMPTAQWQHLKDEFDGLCVFCGSDATKENRGIVPDHLIPVTRFGELVIGNTVPACQTCNDSRGDDDWRPFVRVRFRSDPEVQIERIEAYIKRHPYHPPSPETALSPEEQKSYAQLLKDWESLLARARTLHSSAENRRKHHAKG
ncbi:hypothetical protein E4Q23_09645 [Candidatus Accumulibacter phosphatis]|uniref:HNH nuclease domain-containing protein n=2 Tax=Candidatus Accumulibacter phosphatis TaxID=327160 RepID=A0ABX1TYN1_9PROT|nr:hypothetical protein [Candidatus Accumulibacter phosphatis]